MCQRVCHAASFSVAVLASSCLPCQRAPDPSMLALARSAAFLSEAACGTPSLFPANGKPPAFCQPGCSGSPSGHPCARVARLSTVGGRRLCSFLLRRPDLSAPRSSCCEQLPCPCSVSLLAACPRPPLLHMSAMLPAPRSSCCEQLSDPLCRRAPCLIMLALARSSPLLSDAAGGTPPSRRERQAMVLLARLQW